MALLNDKKSKWDLYKHNLKELLCEDKFGEPVFTSPSRITKVTPENNTTITLELENNYYFDPTLNINGDLLMDNDIHTIKLSSNEKITNIKVDIKGNLKAIEDITLIYDKKLTIDCNAYIKNLHLPSGYKNEVRWVFIFPFSKEAFKENQEEFPYFNYRSLQGKCTGIYGVRWPYLKGISLNETYIKELEEHLIPILKDFPLLIGNYRLTLESGNMKIEQIYQ